MMAMGGSYLLNVGPNAEGIITPEYAERIKKVGEWYNRMEECLECHEMDDFNYHIEGNTYIATKKNGKTYLHFYNGTVSSAFAMKYFLSYPKQIRLMNTGKDLKYAIELLPEYFTEGRANLYLHVSGIPIDDLANEPIVIEIDW